MNSHEKLKIYPGLEKSRFSFKNWSKTEFRKGEEEKVSEL